MKRSAPSRLPMYLLWAGGAASLAGALAFGLLALNAGEDADTACSADGFCPETARSAVDREQGFAIATDVSLAVGVIAAGVGTYLWFRNRRRSVQTIEARISPMPTGAALSLSAPF